MPSRCLLIPKGLFAKKSSHFSMYAALWSIHYTALFILSFFFFFPRGIKAGSAWKRVILLIKNGIKFP